MNHLIYKERIHKKRDTLAHYDTNNNTLFFRDTFIYTFLSQCHKRVVCDA